MKQGYIKIYERSNEMGATRLQVVYRSPEIDEDLDKKILEFLNTLDFICIGKIYNLLTFERIISFEKQNRDVEVVREKRVQRDDSKRDKEAQLTT